MISRYGWRGLLVALALAGCGADGSRARARRRAAAAGHRRARPDRVSRHQPHRGPRPRSGSGLSGADPAEDRLRGAAVRGGERRGERGDVRRRAPADRLAAAAAGGGAGDRDRSERRAPGPGGGLAPRQHPGDHRPGPAAIAASPASCWWGCGRLPTSASATPGDSSGSTPSWPRQNDLPLVPFLLEGVAGRTSLNQADMIHPTAEGQQRMAETVWEVLEPVLRRGA